MARDPSTIGRMYNRNRPVSSVPAPTPVKEEPTPPVSTKSAVRVLSGMKIHGSHTVFVDVDGRPVEMPTAKYVQVLEEQVKNLQNSQRELESKVNKLQRHENQLIQEIRAIRIELNNKVNLR